MMVNVIGQRMNFLMIIHGCWLVVILSRRRRAAIARLWPSYCVFLSVFMVYQYLLCLGIPPALCIGEDRAFYRMCATVRYNRRPLLTVAMFTVPMSLSLAGKQVEDHLLKMLNLE